MDLHELTQELHQAQVGDLEQQLNMLRNSLALASRKLVICKRALEDIESSSSVWVARTWAREALEKVK